MFPMQHSGLLGDAAQISSLEAQSTQHQLGTFRSPNRLPGGVHKPRGGQNTGDAAAGRLAPKVSEAGSSDLVEDYNASAFPPALESEASTYGLPPCKEKCLKRTASRLAPGLWNQARCNSGQNPLGDFVLNSRWDMQQHYSWHYPSTDTENHYFWGQFFGFARIRHENPEVGNIEGLPPVEHYVLACPRYRVSESGVFDLLVKVWETATREPVWQVLLEVGLSGNVPGRDTAKFYYCQMGRWVNFIMDLNSSSPVVYSVKGETLVESTTLSKSATNASFTEYLDESGQPQLVVVLPFLDSSNTDVEFLEQDLFTGSLAPLAVVPVDSFFGSSVDYTANRNVTGPIPWCQDQCFLFVSGKVSTDEIHWGWMGLRADGSRGLSQALEEQASASPPILEQVSFQSDALASGWRANDSYEFGFWELAAATLESVSSGAYATWASRVPVQLPAPSPNRSRILGLSNVLASAWPPAPLQNAGGGAIVDSSKILWSCVLVPEQRLYGGEFVVVETPEDIATWFIFVQYYFAFDEGGFDYHDGYWYAQADAGSDYTVTPFEGGTVSFWRHSTYVGMKPSKRGSWKLHMGHFWKTLLVGIDTESGARFETDISQRMDIPHSVSGGHSGTVTYSGVQPGIEVPDNVWQILSFPESNCVAILRDLHKDEPQGSPSPHLEIYDSSGGYRAMPKLATVPLGSQELLTEELDSQRKVGDRAWNAYALAPPGMKACRGQLENGPAHPQLLVAVWEQKEVTSSMSGFRRAVYHRVDLSNPASPVVSTLVNTSADVGAGQVTNPSGDYPLWGDWDSLILAGGKLSWLRFSKVYETKDPS